MSSLAPQPNSKIAATPLISSHPIITRSFKIESNYPGSLPGSRSFEETDLPHCPIAEIVSELDAAESEAKKTARQNPPKNSKATVSMSDELEIIQSDSGIVADVRAMIAQTREGVARTVNAGMTLLYWRIGSRIQTEVLGNQRAEYGKEILATLSQELTAEFGKGFTKRNLFNMIKFADVFPDPQIVHALCAQLGWTHFRTIIAIKDDLARDFYTEMCRVERWSTRTLDKKIDSMLFIEGLRSEPQKQTEISPTPENGEVVLLSDYAVVQTGIEKGRKVESEEAIEEPYLRVENVQDGYL